MTASIVVRALRSLDPTWWRKAPRGYDQQDGLSRALSQAKRRAAEITKEVE